MKEKNIGDALYFIGNTGDRLAKEFYMQDRERISPERVENVFHSPIGIITDNTIKGEYNYICICENGVQYIKDSEVVEEVYYTDIFKDYINKEEE